MRAALERHGDILRSSIRTDNGFVFATGGDGFAAAFSQAGDAVNAAHATQRALRSEPWPAAAVIRVRMGLHSGETVVLWDGLWDDRRVLSDCARRRTNGPRLSR